MVQKLKKICKTCKHRTYIYLCDSCGKHLKSIDKSIWFSVGGRGKMKYHIEKMFCSKKCLRQWVKGHFK